jgi:hypothetical protein
MWRILIALGFLLLGITLAYQPYGQLLLHTNLTIRIQIFLLSQPQTIVGYAYIAKR